MSSSLWFVLGVGLGITVVVVLNAGSEGSCCKRVSDGVREKVAGKLGEGVAGVGDMLGLWGAAPTVLDLIGYK